MGSQDNAKAADQNIEGNVPKAAGALTDHQVAQTKGKAKQAEANIHYGTEAIKDEA